MSHIKSLNEELSIDNNSIEGSSVEELFQELTERSEFLCTGNVCGADVTLV